MAHFLQVDTFSKYSFSLPLYMVGLSLFGLGGFSFGGWGGFLGRPLGLF
jgi:hypothetical protein